YASASSRPGASVMPEAQRCAPDAIRHVSLGYNFRLPEIAAAVALAELERLEELVALRTECARLYAEAVSGCRWLVPQRVPNGYTHSWWTYVCRLTEDGPPWHDFRRKFVELGGDGFYGAWRPTYREPVFPDLSAEVAEHPERYPHWAGVLPDYREVSCPVMERVQPKLIQLKTNYWDAELAHRQADALARAIRSFSA
ncbi:MAG: DegT/DnrJ/EryC1/StrS family aminotransferase, partial [Planctomycetota bacterium]